MGSSNDDVMKLAAALDQQRDLIRGIQVDQADLPTPCSDWTVTDLVRHIITGTENFARSVRGEDVDWSAAPGPLDVDAAAQFGRAADDLVAATAEAEAAQGVAWQLAEISVHTWDLATALMQPTAALDPELAREGLEFMRTGLTDENRGDAFAPEQSAPDDADPYQQIAAFAGRRV